MQLVSQPRDPILTSAPDVIYASCKLDQDLDPLMWLFHMTMSCERSEPLITYLMVKIISLTNLFFSLYIFISGPDFIKNELKAEIFHMTISCERIT